MADIAVKSMERFAPGLGELVEAREVITPEDMETDYGLTGGHVYHAEPGLDQFFAWRPLNGEARYRLQIEGLYLAGSGAHPGGGITGGPGRQRRTPDPRRHEVAAARARETIRECVRTPVLRPTEFVAFAERHPFGYRDPPPRTWSGGTACLGRLIDRYHPATGHHIDVRFFARRDDAVVFETGRRYSWGRRGDTYYIWDKRQPGDKLGHAWEANAQREFRWLEQEAAHRRRRRWRRLSIVVGLVVTTLIAVGIGVRGDGWTDDEPVAGRARRSVTRSGATSTSRADTGSDAPSGWSVLSASSTAQVMSPGGTVTISIQVAPEGAVGTASDAFVSDLAAAWTDVQIEAALPRTAGELPGLSVAGSAIDETGDPIRFLSIVLDSGARNHAISVSVPRAWNAALFMPAVDVLLASFEPVDAP